MQLSVVDLVRRHEVLFIHLSLSRSESLQGIFLEWQHVRVVGEVACPRVQGISQTNSNVNGRTGVARSR